MIPLSRTDDRYPERLRALARPPDPLWVSGEVACLAGRPAVAVVGTRRLTPYGERVARDLGGALAGAGAVVISGLAQGIDSEAHRAALDASGTTIAVLGEGIAAFDAGARGRRRLLATRIRRNGALVSEYEPRLGARAWMFARRNTTIVALADAVVVVEAGETSGALITASEARRVGRPLFAVPGPLGAAGSMGTNRLIARGDAQALCGTGDLLAAIGLAPAGPAAPPGPLADLLAQGPLGQDGIAARLGLSRAAAATLLAAALLRGEIVMTGDGRVARR